MQSVGQAAPVRGGGMHHVFTNKIVRPAEPVFTGRPLEGRDTKPARQPQRKRMGFHVGRALKRMNAMKVTSMARGGMVHAPKYKGKLVLLHNGEMVIPARQVKAVQKAMRLLK